MADLPARCRQCGLLFPARNFIGGGGSARISLRGNTYRPCPNCGGTADILDGEYQFHDDLLSLISGPRSSIEGFLQLAAIVQQSRANKEAPEVTVSKLSEVSPVAARIAKLLPHPNIPAYLSLIVAVGSLVWQMQQPAPLTAAEAAVLLQQAAAQVQKQSHDEGEVLKKEMQEWLDLHHSEPSSPSPEQPPAFESGGNGHLGPFPIAMKKLADAQRKKRQGKDRPNR